MDRYFSSLSDEIEKKGARCLREVDNVYIGGGTPSVAWKYFPSIGESLYRSFRIKKDAEISVECNPESVTKDFISAAKALGVNRVSVGVQSLSDPLLRRIGRAHDRASALRALDALTSNFWSVNADVMVGLPDQRAEDLDDTLNVLLSYPLDHLSCYSLILEKGTPLLRAARSGAFRPDDDLAVDLYDRAVARLAEDGYERYEISNFTKSGCVCRYNVSVWQYADYLGLGLGASSFEREDGFPARRYRNSTDMMRYIGTDGTPRVRAQKIPTEEGMREFVMLGLRLSEGLNVGMFREIFGRDFFEVYGEKVRLNERFLAINNDRVSILPQYIYTSNYIISELIY